MIRLSPGILASTYQMLQMLSSHQVSKQVLFLSYPSIEGVNIQDVFDTALSCKWISIADNRVIVSRKAESFMTTFDLNTKRTMLADYIISIKPPWSSLMTKGRKECVSFIPVDVLACFREAELMYMPPTDDAVEWWDNILCVLREEQKHRFVLIGRKGERLSLEYEFKRTRVAPKWQAIESNLLGYDILSQVSDTERVPLCIEVKSSEEKIKSAMAHITRNEWDTVLCSNHYLFHFWLLSATPHLAILSVDVMSPHIPGNKGTGQWESVQVPFCAFESHFFIP